jgi:two-component system chemotaxis response regulator CheB
MKDRIVVIGASLNGIAALLRLVKDLPKDLNAPVFIAQHIYSHSPGALPHLLMGAGPLPAVHPKDRAAIRPGCIYVAPPDRHMLIEPGRIRLSHGPKENLTRPAVDPLFRSAAIAYGSATVGVVLTGQLDDGTAGLLAIKDRGGVAIVQDPAEAPAPGMPRSALKHVAVDKCCPLAEIAPLIVALVADPPGVDAGVTQLMDIENRIALGTATVDDWWDLEQMSTPSGLTCPDCRNALYEIGDKRVVRFRCRSGHGFSAESLISGQASAVEDLLASLFGALIEEASLAGRLAKLPALSDDLARRTYLGERAERLREQAEEIGAWMRATSGLIEPEPAPEAAA